MYVSLLIFIVRVYYALMYALLLVSIVCVFYVLMYFFFVSTSPPLFPWVPESGATAFPLGLVPLSMCSGDDATGGYACTWSWLEFTPPHHGLPPACCSALCYTLLGLCYVLSYRCAGSPPLC